MVRPAAKNMLPSPEQNCGLAPMPEIVSYTCRQKEAKMLRRIVTAAENQAARAAQGGGGGGGGTLRMSAATGSVSALAAGVRGGGR